LYLAVFLSSFLPEMFFQSLAAVGENVFELTANEDGMGNRAKRAEGESIVNKAGHQYTCRRFFKVVQMMPESARSADLVIDELWLSMNDWGSLTDLISVTHGTCIRGAMRMR
jgi:putative heme iron utilization protein